MKYENNAKQIGLELIKNKNFKFVKGMLVADKNLSGWAGRILSTEPFIYVACRTLLIAGKPEHGEGWPTVHAISSDREIYPDLSDEITLLCITALYYEGKNPLLNRIDMPSPSLFYQYLFHNKWKIKWPNDRALPSVDSMYWKEYVKSYDGRLYSIEVPQKFDAPDYPRAFRMLIEDIARLEDKTVGQILLDIQACGTTKVCPECCYSDGIELRSGNKFCHRCGYSSE